MGYRAGYLKEDGDGTEDKTESSPDIFDYEILISVSVIMSHKRISRHVIDCKTHLHNPVGKSFPQNI